MMMSCGGMEAAAGQSLGRLAPQFQHPAKEYKPKFQGSLPTHLLIHPQALNEIVFITGLQPSLAVQVVFKTRIFHCNVDSVGNLGLSIVKDGWVPALTISKVLQAIRSIFTTPDLYNPQVPGIGRLYLTDRAKHDELAAERTLRFAK